MKFPVLLGVALVLSLAYVGVGVVTIGVTGWCIDTVYSSNPNWSSLGLGWPCLVLGVIGLGSAVAAITLVVAVYFYPLREESE